MYAQFKGTGKERRAYIAKSYRLKRGDKTSTVIIESLGTLSEIRAAHGCDDPESWVRDRARELTAKEKEGTGCVTVTLDPSLPIPRGHQRKVMGGMLPLLPLYHGWLGLGEACRSIRERRRFDYDLSAVLSTLVYGRILAPDSKLATAAKARSFAVSPRFSMDNVYNALSVLSEECTFLQRSIYESTCLRGGRRTDVVYYDCTNYYFEIEKEDPELVTADGKPSLGLRKYGHSKEHRPNPIVQLGMFMDADGMPLAFCVNPGNTPETQTIVPLEEALANEFGLSTFVCCTDGGLGSQEVRSYNTTEGREYITVQSLKDRKVAPEVQQWALSDAGWTVPGHEGEHTVEEAGRLLGDGFRDAVIYKDKWFKVGASAREEHFVVTYSEKYAEYQRRTRDEQVARARKRIGSGKSLRRSSPNDCARFIAETRATRDGEVAELASFTIDQAKIDSEARFDGFYALATSLDNAPEAILRANHYRYEIEAIFRVTKTDLELRPIFLQRRDRIVGHFIVCFIALLMVKRLQKSLGGAYSVERILECLRQWDYTLLEAHGYLPSFDRTELTDRIKGICRQPLDSQIITKPMMRRIIRELSAQ